MHRLSSSQPYPVRPIKYTLIQYAVSRFFTLDTNRALAHRVAGFEMVPLNGVLPQHGSIRSTFRRVYWSGGRLPWNHAHALGPSSSCLSLAVSI